MNYILRYARLIYSKKLPDRFLSCQVTTGTESDKIGKRGTIIALVEINSPWQQATAMGQIMINRLGREFFRGTSSNDIANFENAVKQVNEAIANNELEKDPQWRQKINAFLALVIGNEVHFTQIGSIWSDILRKNKLLKVSDPDMQTSTPVNFIFSSLTSGHLEDDDILMVGTKKMLEPLVDFSSNISHPSQLAPYIIGQEKNNHIFSGIALQLNSDESLAEKDTGNYPDTIYLDQPLELVGKKIQYTFTNTIIPGYKKTSQGIKNGSKKTYKYIKEKVWPHVSKGLSVAYSASKSGLKKAGAQTGKTFSHVGEKINSSDYKINYYNRNSKTFSNIFVIKLAFILKKIKKIKIGNVSLFQGKMVYASLGILLIIILCTVSFIRYNATPKTMSRDQVKTKIAEIAKKSDEARNAILYGENDKAREILQSALSEAENLKKTTEDSTELENQITQIYTQLDQIDKVTRLNHEIEQTPPANTKKIFVLDGKIWAITSGGNIYDAPAAGGSFSQETEKASEIKVATANEKNNVIYIQTKDEKMFIFSVISESVKEVSIESGEWENSNGLVMYVNNLYSINSAANNILKYAARTSSFAAGQTYLNQTISDIKDLAIDGSIYLLTKDSLKKVEKNKVSEINLSGMPSNISINNFQHIYTSVDRENLLISTSDRLFAFDKTGKFINQYAFDQNNDIQDFYIASKGTSLWVLTKDKVLSYNLR